MADWAFIMVLFCDPAFGKGQQMKANARRAFGREEREKRSEGVREGKERQKLRLVKVGTERLWFRSGLAGHWALGMKGEYYAFDQFGHYSGCCWSDPLFD